MSQNAVKPKISGPRFRFISEPPDAVHLALGDFSLPERLRGPDFDPERPLTVPCQDVVWGPSPAVRLGVLSGLAPGHVVPDMLDASDEIVPILPAALALRYELNVRCEQIGQPPEVAPIFEEPPPAPADSHAPAVEGLAEMPAEAQPAASAQPAESFAPDAAPVGTSPEVEYPPAPEAPEPELHIAQPLPRRPVLPPMPIRIFRPETAASAPEATIPPQPAQPEAPEPQQPPTDPAAENPVPLKQPIPTQRRTLGIFASLRRKSPEPAGPEESPAPDPVPPANLQQQEPVTPEAILENPVPEGETVPPPGPVLSDQAPSTAGTMPSAGATRTLGETDEGPRYEEDAHEPLPAAPVGAAGFPQQPTPQPPTPPEAVGSLVEEPGTIPAPPAEIEPAPIPEPCPAPVPGSDTPSAETDKPHHWEIQGEEVPDVLPAAAEERLQELFLTEERLNLDRALALCGGLPGIRACILTRGSTILGAHRVPDAIDIVSLTANAKTMLDGVRTSSMRMGLGSIPAITIHSEKGPVSFFYSGELLMLVLHADRGFVPGVRERLAGAVEAMTRGPLPLPMGERDL